MRGILACNYYPCSTKFKVGYKEEYSEPYQISRMKIFEKVVKSF